MTSTDTIAVERNQPRRALKPQAGKWRAVAHSASIEDFSWDERPTEKAWSDTDQRAMILLPNVKLAWPGSETAIHHIIIASIARDIAPSFSLPTISTGHLQPPVYPPVGPINLGPTSYWQPMASFMTSGEDTPDTTLEDASAKLLAEALVGELKRETVQAEIGLRLTELRAAGIEEGLPWSSESERDLRSFLMAVNPATRPRLSLLDSGNLRALWTNDAGERVALEFCGRRATRYVIFVRKGNGEIDRSAGRFANHDEIFAALRTQNLLRMVTG